MTSTGWSLNNVERGTTNGPTGACDGRLSQGRDEGLLSTFRRGSATLERSPSRMSWLTSAGRATCGWHPSLANVQHIGARSRLSPLLIHPFMFPIGFSLRRGYSRVESETGALRRVWGELVDSSEDSWEWSLREVAGNPGYLLPCTLQGETEEPPVPLRCFARRGTWPRASRRSSFLLAPSSSREAPAA